MRRIILILNFLFLLISCGRVSKEERELVDSLCQQSYRMRYADIDSCEHLAQRAYNEAADYVDGKARALNRLAYVHYQRMDYDGTLCLLDSVCELSSNHITLLCASVMRMKVCQRIGDGEGFYESRSKANRHLKRIAEDMDMVTGIDLADYEYAWSEYHIISSTYYYYQDQDSLAKAEIFTLYPDIEEIGDTAQLLYYYYMLGSGGLVDGSYEAVAIDEFRYLINCYSMARRTGYIYFEANALQALASRLKNPHDREIIFGSDAESMMVLLGQHMSWMPENVMPSDNLLPLALAKHSISCFKDYKDLFQTACVYRTIGEIEAYNGNYEEALSALDSALACVDKHHQMYYHNQTEGTDGDKLQAYNPDTKAGVSIERRWIEDPGINTVPEWMAGIRQQLSMLFSAMDNKLASDYNRNIYLDILESTSQNLEMESRMHELQSENAVQARLLWAVGGLFVLLLLCIIYFILSLKRHEYGNKNVGSDKRILKGDKAKVEELIGELEEAQENCEVSKMRISQNKTHNSEKRAKVSLVQAVVPFLDRIINEVNRMKRQGKADDDQLQYVSELSEQIIDYNDILTEWIKMERGELSLKISTIQLSKLFSILERGHFAYDQKGVKLNVVSTELNVKADEALTLFMLNTLADNARKFTPSGGSVTISAEATDEYVELSVTDTGCGLKEEDVDTILNNKAYDATKIGVDDNASAKQNKGFGFGLMNCKGIIEKYKKTSALFRVCYFGIESEVGKGSRFFFRLPRVMMLICAFFSAMCMSAQTSPNEEDAQHYFDLAVECNLDGSYEDALAYADSALLSLNPDLVLYHEANMNMYEPMDIMAFKQGLKWDFPLLIRIRNEVAISALALHEWDLYTYNNRICINLHKLCNQDATLPFYCEELSKTQSASRQLTAVLAFISIIIIFFVYMVFRGRKRVASKIASELQSKIEQTNDMLSHYRFEENRLYVQNQVMDNCLSTIKHESMYYPSRIKQLADRMLENRSATAEDSASQTADIKEMVELTAYYKELYTLLSSQAERQVAQQSFRREQVLVTDMCSMAKREFASILRKNQLDMQFDVLGEGVCQNISVHADSILLTELFRQLFRYFFTMYRDAEKVEIHVEPYQGFLKCSLKADTMHFSEDEAHNLFYPDSRRIALLIVKQIIRDFDAMGNNPGLRLVADEDAIWFTLLICNT
ncbi:MAG: DUF5112 domain-containing protein [Bacteroidaceae bacterium]|nr:DUF5112 domain-containing protein [Bacteroidaceae bacterium]